MGPGLPPLMQGAWVYETVSVWELTVELFFSSHPLSSVDSPISSLGYLVFSLYTLAIMKFIHYLQSNALYFHLHFKPLHWVAGHLHECLPIHTSDSASLKTNAPQWSVPHHSRRYHHLSFWQNPNPNSRPQYLPSTHSIYHWLSWIL